MVGLTPVTVGLLVAVIVGVSAAMLAWRERPEPGATWLTLLLVGQVWWTVFLLFEIEATEYATKVLWYDVQWLGTVIIPVAWLLFALEYTGRNRYVNSWTIAGLSVIPATTVLIALTGVGEGFLVVELVPVEMSTGSFLRAEPGPWYFFIAGYTYLLGLLGSIPILQLVRDDARPFRGQSAALLVGTAVPWISSIGYLLGYTPVSGLDLTPVAFAASGIAYLLALSRFRLLIISPAPRRHARQMVFDTLHDPAFVLDTEGYVVDLNQSAVATFDLDRYTTVGSAASAAIPSYGEFTADDDSEYVTAVGSNGRRPYDVSVRDVTGVHSRSIGRVIVFHDIGEYLSLQQRLEVLNRVFRHNVRTETNLICGYVDRIAENPEDGEAISIVKQSAGRIHELSERTRSASDMFDPTSNSLAPRRLDELLPVIVDRVQGEYPAADVTLDGELPPVSVPEVLDVVIDNLLSNAIRHNPRERPSALVSARVDGEWVEVTVADDGQGMNEAERRVLERGTETPLEHGSGIGLWIVKWGAELAGGTVTFADREPTGTIVTVRVPSSGSAES